jgi:hypothetical protein
MINGRNDASLSRELLVFRVISGISCLIVFAWFEFLIFILLVSRGFGAIPPISDLVFLSEWLGFGAAGFFFAYHPALPTSTGAKLVLVVGYIAIAVANFTFMFAGGKCVDMRGNIYSEADILLQKDGFLSEVDFTPPSDDYLCIAQIL